jgi:hypothetical protein
VLAEYVEDKITLFKPHFFKQKSKINGKNKWDKDKSPFQLIFPIERVIAKNGRTIGFELQDIKIGEYN